ncbi:MAG: hypothetical protein JKY27_10280 [Magnetovibrio sp.]|nr:hypothetical protein [Magnetovibrio sp.]
MPVNARYKIFPQMEAYDDIDTRRLPFLMFSQQANYCSDVVNTDTNGFRLAGLDGKQRLDSFEKSSPVSILTGGSSAFGIGATSDSRTIPALLSKNTGKQWMNFGGRAHVSTQEFISFMYYREMVGDIENIVICSGFNDLYLYFASKYYDLRMGSFFSASKYFENTCDHAGLRRLVRETINKTLGLIYGDYCYKNISNRDAVSLLFRKTSISNLGLDRAQDGIISFHHDHPNEVIDILRTNIRNWKVIADHYDARLIYVLQPFSNWLGNRNLTPNEKVVFEILDVEQAALWKPLADKLDGIYDWYSESINSICTDEGVAFRDSNIVLNVEGLSKDVFVDRVHLTDHGYQIVSNLIASEL